MQFVDVLFPSSASRFSPMSPAVKDRVRWVTNFTISLLVLMWLLPLLPAAIASTPGPTSEVNRVRFDGTVEILRPAMGEVAMGQEVSIQRKDPKASPDHPSSLWRIGWGTVTTVHEDSVLVKMESISPGYTPRTGDVAVFSAGQAPRPDTHTKLLLGDSAPSHPGSGGDADQPKPQGPAIVPMPIPDPVVGARSDSPAIPGGTTQPPPTGEEIMLSVGLQGSYIHAFQADPQGAPLDDRSGKEGSGGGGGLLVEGRFYRHIALETGLLIEQNSRKKTNTYLGTAGTAVHFYPRVIANNMRIPFILKGVLPVPTRNREAARLWIGAGPEVVIPFSARTEMEYDIVAPPGTIITNRAEVEAMARDRAYRYRVEKKSALHLTTGLGFAVKTGPMALGMGLRASWNFGHDNRYADPLTGGVESSEHTLDVRASMNLVFDIPLL